MSHGGVIVLYEFKFNNYRSFRDETILSMLATGLGSFKNSIIEHNNTKLLPCAAIIGKNGGGKSNVIRAFWLAVQFVKNSQRTQHENSDIPVIPFSLNDYSFNQPTTFDFIYSINGIKYWYGYSATKDKIIEEYLYHAPKKQKALIFKRSGQQFSFTEEKATRKLISKAVAENQLFFSVACTMNDSSCINAMRWFREYIFFSRDYADIPSQLIEYSEDKNMLRIISEYAKIADVGIEKMRFDFNRQEISENGLFPDDLPEGVKTALLQFSRALAETSNNSEVHLKLGQITAKAYHLGINNAGKSVTFELDLSDESDGTRKLMALAPAIESTLAKGGVLLVDEIEKELHPILVNYIVSKFQSKNSNPHGAQIVFTTHNTELLNLELLRKDQIYLADKNPSDGVSELYCLSDFSTRTTDNIRKGYLLGKYGAIPNVDVEEVM